MARSDFPWPGVAEVVCAAATAVYFYVASPYLAHVMNGPLSSPRFFAYWRWSTAVQALALGSIALAVQRGVLLWPRNRGYQADLLRLAIFVSVYWVLLSGLGPALYGMSRVYPDRMYTGPHGGLAGPVWAERHERRGGKIKVFTNGIKEKHGSWQGQ